MPAEVVWLDQAQDDLQTIHDHIGTHDPHAAASYVEAIVAACAKLAPFPQSGRVYHDRYRVLVVKKHLIFHRYDEAIGQVAIVTILDGRRDITALLKGP